MYTWERTFQLNPGAAVNLVAWVGPVKVYGWDQPSIKAVATSDREDRLDELITVEESMHGLQITAQTRRSFFGLFDRGEEVRLELKVPVGTPCRLNTQAGSVEVVGTQASVGVDTGSGNVTLVGTTDADIESGSGSVVVKNIAGSVRADTGSGSVHAENVRGNLSADTGSGHAHVVGVQGHVHIDTGSGHAHLTDVTGSVEIDTGSGSVSADRIAGSTLHVDTGGGAIRLTNLNVANLEVDSGSGRVDVELAAIHPGGTYSLDTASGGVTVALPPTAGLSVEIESGSGRITHTGLPLQVRHRDEGELRADMNGGGATLEIDSGSGGVLLKAVVGAAVEPPSPVAKVRETIKGDAALENSSQVSRVLKMVEQGKLTPDEAEAILKALDEEEAPA